MRHLLQFDNFRVLGQEHSQGFQRAHITTISKGKINSLLDSGKISNHHNNTMDLFQGILISTIHKVGCRSITSSKCQGMVPSVVPRDSRLSKPNSYGKTATNYQKCLSLPVKFFRFVVVVLYVQNLARIIRAMNLYWT